MQENRQKQTEALGLRNNGRNAPSSAKIKQEEMMRRTLAIVVLCLAMAGCSAQKRAEKHLRRAVELCPELTQMTARPIDTVFTLASPPDSCLLPIAPLIGGHTITINGQNGTFTAHADTSAIAISYRPDTILYRYTDTVWLPQVTVTETAPPAKRQGAWRTACLAAFGVVLGFALLRATDRLIDDIHRN